MFDLHPARYSAATKLASHFWKDVFYILVMAEWSFLTNHARALVCIARDPGVRLREIATVLGVTERRAFGIVDDLNQAGYVVKHKDGRRNRYRIQHHVPLPGPIGREPTIGELLGVLVDTSASEFAPPRDHDSRGAGLDPEPNPGRLPACGPPRQ